MLQHFLDLNGALQNGKDIRQGQSHHILFLLEFIWLFEQVGQHLYRFWFNLKLLRFQTLEDKDNKGMQVLVFLKKEEFAKITSGCLKNKLHQGINVLIICNVPVSDSPLPSFILFLAHLAATSQIHQMINWVDDLTDNALRVIDPLMT